MPDLSKRLVGLSSEQRKELARRLEQKGLQTSLAKDHPEGLAEAAKTDLHLGGEVTNAAMNNQGVKKGIDFSLLFFSGNGATATGDKYQLLLESAKFADTHGFSAVWTPERHFQAFGGLYPNPSVLSAALAVITDHIQIRAGSIALPLHNPIRVAEEWSVVDNLSGGRVALSFASGYHPGDFTLSPDNYQNRKEIILEYIEIVRKLWAGEAVNFRGVNGEEVSVTVLPKPLQLELPIWLTSSNSTGTWIKAGEIGTNVLTGLAGIGDQSFDNLAEKIVLYRQSLAKHGHNPQAGKVALMLHTYIGQDMDAVREKVRAPLSGYLRTFMAQDEYLTTKDTRVGVGNINDEDKDALVSFAFERFLDTNSLLGTPDKCAEMLVRLEAIGVDEVACFIDFGLDMDSVMESLIYLDELRAHFCPQETTATTT